MGKSRTHTPALLASTVPRCSDSERVESLRFGPSIACLLCVGDMTSESGACLEKKEGTSVLLSALGMCGSGGASHESFARRLIRARAARLNDMEAYFLDDPKELQAPLNPRNEAAALAMLVERDAGAPLNGEGISDELMECLRGYSPIANLKLEAEPLGKVSAEGQLQRWCADKGAVTSLCAANFASYGGGPIRGLMAAHDLSPGDCAISIKEDMLISTQIAATSDLGMALDAMGVKDDGHKAVIWTMVDRVDHDSVHKPFWQSLPETLKTGLSFNGDELEMLKGTPAFDELVHAKEHIRGSYVAIVDLLNALVATYPDDLTSEQFSWESYLWATQLWYAYAMEVEFLDGETRSCLVPYATLMNHSVHPHVVQYGKIDPVTRSLRFRTFRACKMDEQCFLSYGPLPNIKLLIYYGFAIKSNPYDVLTIDLPVPSDQDGLCKLREDVIQQLGIGKQHFVRAGSIPRKLLSFAMVSVADMQELQHMKKTGQVSVQKGSEKKAFEMLRSVLENLAFPAQHPNPEGRAIVEFINMYKDGCQNIVDTSLKNVLRCIDACVGS